MRKGLWCLGEHFLSIRLWEPNFKAKTANVSLVTVWIRFNSLPIEYYDAKVLKKVVEAVGKVLRIDTHTASEARGHYARLCVQIDMDKPLITTMLIGKLEQQVLYEGIQKLCFGCGRFSHQRESCPFVVRGPKPPQMEAPGIQTMPVHVPRSRHDPSTSANSDNAGGDVREGDVQEGDYGPWLVVTRKRFGHQGTKN